MPTFIVTIIDLIGVFVPGLVLLIGMLLVPTELGVRFAPLLEEPLVSNVWVVGGIWVVVAYILGFLVRLISIRLMNFLTIGWWTERIKTEAGHLDSSLITALSDKQLTDSLKTLSTESKKFEPGHYAPFFHYAKRIVRHDPIMWAEAERLEAEVRLTAGLFIPLVILVIDGLILGFLGKVAGWWLFGVALPSAILLLLSFPARRHREVLYDQLLALIVLKAESTVTRDRHSKRPRLR